MGPAPGVVLVALLCLVYMTGRSLSSACRVPNWDDSAGPNPFTERRGKVVLVALHKGYCGYCVQQAGRLFQLKNELISEGYPDVDMIIINGGENRSRNRVQNLINASPLEVIQDTLQHVLYRQVFRASKDDFLVYDRCSQAAVWIPHPYSNLELTITKQVIKAVHMGRHNCYCSLDYAPRSMDDMMQGDDPGVAFYQSRNMNRYMLHCNTGDSSCLQFQSALNNFSRRRSRGRNVGRGAFRRMLNGIRRRFESTDSEMDDTGLIQSVNQGQEVEGRRRTGFGGGAGFGGGRNQGFGRGRRRGNFNRRRNFRLQPTGRRQTADRPVGGV